jgi:ribonuclease P/MRP protein subunit POP5
MSIRPPTLREKRRYLLAKIEPCGVQLEGKDLYYAVHEAITSLWGDAVVAAMQPAVISIENGHAILRCRRGTERECAIGLSTVTGCRDNRIALRITATSGTIDSLRDRIKESGPYVLESDVTALAKASDRNAGPAAETRDSVRSASPETSDCTFDTRAYQIVYCDGHKVDVIEKGFKNTHRLFLTTADLEEK